LSHPSNFPEPLARADRRAPVSVDVVIPIWNEQDMLPLLLERLDAIFSPASRRERAIKDVCYLFVDDGSTDRSATILSQAIQRGLPAVLVRLSRNYGHQSAVSAGMAASRGDVTAVIDADLQDPPELILDMLEKWREGSDVVYARRRGRDENPVKRLGYWGFYRLVALLADIKVPLDAGDFSLMDRRVVRAICDLPETLRFPRVLRAWVGFSQAGIDYDRPRRHAGRAKYTLARLYRLATDGVISASVRPLQVAQVFSVTYLFVILALGLLALLRSPAWARLDIPPWALVSYLLILSGNFVQVFCIYILGAYVGRTYLESKGRPPYLVMEVVGRREGDER
jgi:polyisoprenyl-phosphate glycosyltransferase